MVVSWIAGVAKVAFGIGAGVFLTPVLALVLPPKVAVALMAPMMVITDFVALRHHWGKWDSRHILVLLPTAVVGVVPGRSAHHDHPPDGDRLDSDHAARRSHGRIPQPQALRAAVHSSLDGAGGDQRDPAAHAVMETNRCGLDV